MKKIGTLAAALAAVCVLGAASAEAADVAKGKKVFNRCKACHSLEAGKKKVGPSLHGVFGRTSGTLEGFKFSKAMKEAAIVWNDETIGAYLKAPKKYIKGNKMAFAGLRKQADIDNLMAYLKENTQ